VEEISKVVNSFRIVTLREAGIEIDIPEPHDTLEANAEEKATVIHSLTQQDCFSEDTGLEVAALNGEPGVRSARYAGDVQDFAANVNKLLTNLQGITRREARFRTVIALIWQGKLHFFEGICPGVITASPTGTNGFGYDPVFIPEGSHKTFAEMTLEEKNRFSHRRKATDQLVAFLQNL
jgi:XTP/dITP diphosphohydrolase